MNSPVGLLGKVVERVEAAFRIVIIVHLILSMVTILDTWQKKFKMVTTTFLCSIAGFLTKDVGRKLFICPMNFFCYI